MLTNNTLVVLPSSLFASSVGLQGWVIAVEGLGGGVAHVRFGNGLFGVTEGGGFGTSNIVGTAVWMSEFFFAGFII